MPADDSFFRNLKRMHVVFAVSCIALLAVTIWMLGWDSGAGMVGTQESILA